jgi:thioredoxin 1
MMLITSLKCPAFAATLLLLCCGLTSENQEKRGVTFFNGTLKEAMAKAKAEGKYIFFDAYAAWCGPCKAMERDVFSNEELGKYMNEKFVSIRIDMEKGEGPELAKRYTSIDGYPSLLFLDNKGHVMKTLLGSRNVEDFTAESKLVAK